jgi:hypothetical protein
MENAVVESPERDVVLGVIVSRGSVSAPNSLTMNFARIRKTPCSSHSARATFNFESHHALGRLTTPTKLQVSTSQSWNPNGSAFL